MQRAITGVLTAALLLLLAFALTPAARACVEDSEGLELIDGELPGGG
jgi:hypothetical protein